MKFWTTHPLGVWHIASGVSWGQSISSISSWSLFSFRTSLCPSLCHEISGVSAMFVV